MSARAPSLDDFADLADDEPSLDDFAAPAAIRTGSPSVRALALVPAAPLAYSPAVPAEIAAPAHEGLRPDFTFSKGPLAKSGCAWWLQPAVPWFDSDNRYKAGGRGCHEDMRDIARAAVLRAPLPALHPDPKRQALVVAATRWLFDKGILRMRARSGDSLVGTGPVEASLGLQTEVAFAYDTETRKGRALEDPRSPDGTPWPARWYADHALRAAYAGPGGPVRATEICGRIDLLCLGFDEHGAYGWVRDYKFHFGPSSKDAQGQLAFCALAVASAYDLTRVSASAVHIWEDRDVAEEHLLAYEDDGEAKAELGPSEIARIAAWIETLAHPAANDPVPQEGPHCADRDCPAVAACPVTGAVVAQVLPAESLVRRKIAEPLASNEDAAWALIAADLLIEVGEQLRVRAKTYADEHRGIVQSDGRVFSGQPVTSSRPDLSVPGAVEALRELGLAEAVQVSTTWTEIKKRGGAALEKRVREALAAISAVKLSSSMRYEARNPKMGGER